MGYMPNFVVDEKHLEQNLRVVTFGRISKLFIFEHIPSFFIILDFQQRNGNFTEKFILVIFVFIIDGDFKYVMNILDIAGIIIGTFSLSCHATFPVGHGRLSFRVLQQQL